MNRPTAPVWPLTWQGGCHEEGATWFGGPWFVVSAGASSAVSSPSGPWGQHISLPSLCKVYQKIRTHVTKPPVCSARFCWTRQEKREKPGYLMDAQWRHKQWFSSYVEVCGVSAGIFFLKKREYCAVKFELFLSLEITDTDRTHRNIVCAAEEIHVFAH